jgi:hypothetical protein
MSLGEVDRLEIIRDICHKRIKQKEGAKRLGRTVRQTRRLCKEFTEKGVISLVSKKRGKPSNRRISDEVSKAVIAAIRERYLDFGPSFAHEKLTDPEGLHKFKIGVESVRQLMIDAGIWKAKGRKQIDHHQGRVRRPELGELVQLDGSPHAWFEDRAESCCLLLAVDDATSAIMAGHFVKTECTQGYFDLMETYLHQHGRPMTLYSDRHGIFRVNAKEAESGTGDTQFGRAMRELGIEGICANSPQAKGRVERMNKTLQDRLIKEMRLEGISDMPNGNKYLEKFIKKHNKKYAVTPASPTNAHRSAMPTKKQLDLIFSIQDVRKLSKSLELQYNNMTYQIQVKTPSYTMRGASVKICERQGVVDLIYKGKTLAYNTIDKKNQAQEIVSSKEINPRFDGRSRGHKPKDTHPWKSAYPEKTKKDHFSTAFSKAV